MKGVGVGTGVRWQDKVGIGYVTTRDASGAIIIDRKKPYFAPGETNVDLKLVEGSYTAHDLLETDLPIKIKLQDKVSAWAIF